MAAGAHDRIRTGDLVLTKDALYRLSYMGPTARPVRYDRAHSPAGGAGNGTRTRDPQLGRLMLYQLSYSRARLVRRLRSFPLHAGWWRGKDSNLRRHKPADLQSAPFGHSGTSPGHPHSRRSRRAGTPFAPSRRRPSADPRGAGEG